jgi:hypothetical protein
MNEKRKTICIACNTRIPYSPDLVITVKEHVASQQGDDYGVADSILDS